MERDIFLPFSESLLFYSILFSILFLENCVDKCCSMFHWETVIYPRQRVYYLMVVHFAASCLFRWEMQMA
jgi:hypothetical protein